MEKIITLVDIGAAGGIQNRWSGVKNLRVIGFEPEKDAFDKLHAEPNRIMLNIALYKEKGVIDFHKLKSPTDSSIFEPNVDLLKKFSGSERFNKISSSKIAVDTLDNQLKENNIEDIDFIKLDTQGSELFILEGAITSLEKAYGVEIECEFQELYVGQPLFRDIDLFLNNLGFRIHDLRNFYWKNKRGRLFGGNKGQLMYAEVLYFKDSVLLPKEKNKISNAIDISLLFGYVDHAMEILSQNEALFDIEELKIYKSRLNKQINFALPKKLRNSSVHRVLLKFANLFKPNLWKGVSWNGDLGNLD